MKGESIQFGRPRLGVFLALVVLELLVVDDDEVDVGGVSEIIRFALLVNDGLGVEVVGGDSCGSLCADCGF